MTQNLPARIEVPVDSVDEGTIAIRQLYDEEALGKLADSFQGRGLIYPIVIRPSGESRYELIIGSRRLRAAKKRGMQSIPATIINDLGDQEALELALTENLQRADMTPFEEATAFLRLVKDFELPIQEVATRVGRGEGFVRRRLQLLSLPQEVQELLADGKLGVNHIDALIRLKSPEEQVAFAQSATRDELSERELVTLIQGNLEAGAAQRSDKLRARPPLSSAKAILRIKGIAEKLELTISRLTEAKEISWTDFLNAEAAVREVQRAAEKGMDQLVSCRDQHKEGGQDEGGNEQKGNARTGAAGRRQGHRSLKTGQPAS